MYRFKLTVVLPNHHSSIILQEYILLHLMQAVVVSCHKAEQLCPCCYLWNFSHIAAHLWHPWSHLHMHKEADRLLAAELFKTTSSQHASEMKFHWQPFLYCGLWGTFWCICIGLQFQVGGMRRHACHVIPRVQYVCVMCVIQCCSLLLVQSLDIPSAALMLHHLTPPQHWSEKIALLAVWGATQKFPKFLGCCLTTHRISVHLHSLQSNPFCIDTVIPAGFPW